MLEKLISVLASPISYIVLICVVITVHELGHYLVGRFFGAAVESFSLGFGKVLVAKSDGRGTSWRIGMLPIGGFVKFAGELQTPDDKQDPKTETDQPDGPPAQPLIGVPYTQLGPWKRLAVSLGGPLANLVFAAAVYAGFGMTLGVPEAQAVRVEAVSGAPAIAAGFVSGDIILEAGGRPVSTPGDVTRVTQLSADEAVSYRVLRGTAELVLSATPEKVERRDEIMKTVTSVGRVGMTLGSVNMEIRKLNPIEATGYGVTSVAKAMGDTMKVLRRLVTRFQDVDKLSGPLGIYNLTDNVTDYQMAQTDVSYLSRIGGVLLTLLELSALLSIGVAIFNLLPIPVLDGGAALLCVAEGITGKAVPEAVHRAGLTIGLVCLLSFAVVITWFDIARWLSA